MKHANTIFGITLALVLCLPAARAQAPSSEAKPNSDTVQTFDLTNINQSNDATEVVTALRNILTPEAKIYFVPSQNAIVLRTTPDQIVLARKLILDLDRPRKSYRLTYTITEAEGGNRIGAQHFSFIVVSGQRTTLKQGSKVPVVTGTYNPGTSSAQTQVTYLDIGLNFDATLDESVNGIRLRTKAEQSSIGEEHSGVGAQDPVVRQTVLEGTSIVTPNKPLVVGSLDIPGTTRHLEIEVMAELIK